MYTLKETIIVEGVYDKIKLSSYIGSLIFVTNGFSVFNNKKAQETIRTLARKTGIVIFTDSDSAGIKIRNFVKQLAGEGEVKHAYIPEIFGKERRKTASSKEGLLGVEGVSGEVLIDALKKSGCCMNGSCKAVTEGGKITKTDFYSLGLSGGSDSLERRRRLALEIGLPSKLSANMLLDAVNALLTRDELVKILENI